MKEKLLEKLKGKYVAAWCGVYIYSGQLEDWDDTHYLLTDAGVVYETGKLEAPEFADFQKLPGDFWLVARQAEESIGPAPQRA